ncbi:MAG: MFS transporter [Steroidobacteraceae bacterium]
MTASGADAAAGDGWPAPRLAWATVAVLAVAQGFNAVDRHLINLLVGPIKADLHITDAQVGLLLGFSFAIFYTTFGVPVGRLADHYSRRLIIAAGTAFWSLMTVACGLAQTFAQLFGARVAVGAGEATLNPSGYSIIADLVPPARRAKPMGVFIMGHTIGQAITLFAGGLFVQYLLVNDVTLALPGGLELRPWQIAFVVAGLPGLAIALLVLTIREPARRETLVDPVTGSAAASVPLREVAAYIRRHASVYLPVFAGFAFVLLWHMGNTVWAPTFLIRTYHFTPAKVGAVLGLMTLLFNSSGVVLAGALSEWFARRGHADAHLRAAFVGAACALPFGIAAPLMPNEGLALLLLGPAFFFGSLPFTLGPAAMASITPNQMRAQITAIYLLCINLFGFGLGPWLMGKLTDRVFQDEALLRYGIATTAALAVPVGLVFLGRALAHYRALLAPRAG